MYKKNTRDGVEIYLFDPFFGVLNISKMGWGVKTHIRIWNHLSSEYGYESWNCSGMLVDRISFEPLDDDDVV